MFGTASDARHGRPKLPCLARHGPLSDDIAKHISRTRDRVAGYYHIGNAAPRLVAFARDEITAVRLQ